MSNQSTHRKPSNLPSKDSTNSFWHTEPSPLLKGHRTTRELPKHADIVIIGSGITGASIAHHILQAAHSPGNQKPSIVMLEAREACWGATGRNGGHCQPLFLEHPHDPSIADFEYKNYLTIEKLIDERKIDCEFVRQPSVRAIYGEAKLAEAGRAYKELLKRTPELPCDVRILTSKQELDAHRVSSATGAIYTEHAARFWPYKFVAHVLGQLITSTEPDGTFNLQTLTPVTKLTQTTEKRWIVQTERGDIDAGAVFLATNAYTSHLVPQFADLIVPCRGQMSALKPPRSIAGLNRLHTSLGFEAEHMDDYLIQRPPGTEQLMFGGSRQMGPSLGIDDDSTIDKNVARYLRGALIKRCRLYEGNDELEATHEWTGIMAWSSDGLPWVGPVPESSNLYMSAGYTGHGMPNAWLCGQALATYYHNRGSSKEEITLTVQLVAKLPIAYLITPERIAAAMAIGNEATREQL